MYNFTSLIENVEPVGAFIAGLSPYEALIFISVKTQFLDKI